MKSLILIVLAVLSIGCADPVGTLGVMDKSSICEVSIVYDGPYSPTSGTMVVKYYDSDNMLCTVNPGDTATVEILPLKLLVIVPRLSDDGTRVINDEYLISEPERGSVYLLTELRGKK